MSFFNGVCHLHFFKYFFILMRKKYINAQFVCLLLYYSRYLHIFPHSYVLSGLFIDLKIYTKTFPYLVTLNRHK